MNFNNFGIHCSRAHILVVLDISRVFWSFYFCGFGEGCFICNASITRLSVLLLNFFCKYAQQTHDLFFFFFFFWESFNLWRSLLMIAHYHQTKTLISFWCRRGLNPRSLIPPSETLPIELTRTHMFITFLKYFHNKSYVANCYELLLVGKKIISVVGSIYNQ